MYMQSFVAFRCVLTKPLANEQQQEQLAWLFGTRKAGPKGEERGEVRWKFESVLRNPGYVNDVMASNVLCDGLYRRRLSALKF